MKKTWKYVLAALAVSAILGGSLVAQTDDGVVVLGRSRKPAEPSGSGDAAGAVRLGTGTSPGSASRGNRVTPVAGEGPPVAGNAPPTIEPSGIQYSEPAGGFHGANPYGEFAAAGSVGYAVSDDPRQVLFRVGRRNGDIYGLSEGFTNLSAFMPYFTEADSALWFFQPRLVITDQGRGAANLGFGHRAYSHELDRVFSFSTWYDYDTGKQGNYHQVGASFAMIGRNMTFRANGNWVVSGDETQVGTVPVGSTRLQNGMVVQDVTRLTEVAYNQSDFEVSTPIPFLEKYGFEMGGGAYFLFGSEGEDAVGAKARIEAQVTEDIWVNAILSNDKVFNTNVSVNFEVTIPNAPASRWFRRNKVRDSLFASDRRFYRVATNITRRADTVPVMGMGNGGGVAPLMLAIIDPNISDDHSLAHGGSGTEDDPFRSLHDYTEEADSLKDDFAIIFVRRRTDATDLNLDTTITLLDNQALLGEGIQHSLTNLGLTGITLPGSTDGLAVPLLSNAGAPGMDVVTLANANQVAGFTIDAGGIDDMGMANGIVGTNIDGFSINDVSIQNANNGIQIVSDTLGGVGTGMGIIRDNMISGIGLGSTQGVSIEQTAGTLGLVVTGNTITGFQGEDANSNGVLDLSEDTNMNGVLDPGEDIDFDGMVDFSEDLNANGLLDAGFGLRVVASGSSIINAIDPTGTTGLGISGNTFTSNGTGSSIQALGTSLIMLDFDTNTATGSTDLIGSGLEFLADGGRIDLSSFTGNTASGGAGAGGIFQTRSGGIITVSNALVTAFNNNMFTGNALDGMFVEADSGAVLFDQISGSVFDGNGDDGLDLQTTGGGSLTVVEALVGNSYTGNGDNGIELTGGLGGVLDVDIGDATASSSPITGNGGAGIFIGTEGGILMTSLFGITSTGNSGSGVVIQADGGDVILDGIAGNVFRLNGQNGLEIIADNGGRVITPFVGSSDELLSASAGVPGTTQFSNDFALNEKAGLFLGGRSDTLGGTTALIDLGTVTLNRFQRAGEDLDNDGNIDVAEDVNGNGILDPDEDIDGDGRLDLIAEDVSGVIADGTLDPSQGEEGILIDASDLRIAATLTRNSFVGRRPLLDAEDGTLVTAGSGRGIGGRIAGTSTIGGPGGVTLQIGTGIAADVNTFVDSGDAHIGLVLAGNTVNSVEIQNTDFSNAFNGGVNPTTGVDSTPNFLGDGVALDVADTAILTGLIESSTFANNEGDGVRIRVRGNNDAGNDNTFDAARVEGFVIGGSSPLEGNLFDNNGRDGLAVIRAERGQFNNMVVENNAFNANGRNGIFIRSSGADQAGLLNGTPDSIDIIGNDITDNAANGIQFFLGSDADLIANLSRNLIDGSGANGILANERINDDSDSRTLTGRWTENIITNNTDDGIDLRTVMGNDNPFFNPDFGLGLLIGDATVNPIGTLSTLQNLISQNGQDGIDITQGGIVAIGNNIIAENGLLATNAFAVAGINIDSPGSENNSTPANATPFIHGSSQTVNVTSNLITLNNGDGIEWLNEIGLKTLVVRNNEITQNVGRGIDLLNRVGDDDPTDSDNIDPDSGALVLSTNIAFSDVTIIGNDIKGNLQEGIYVVNTSAASQSQAVASNVDLARDGDVLDDAFLRLNIHGNNIIGNGSQVDNFPGTGLVIRVGTSGGGYGQLGDIGTPQAGGFATSGTFVDLDLDGFVDADFLLNAGVSASVTNNTFEGNFGSDVLVHSYTSTVDPIVTTGTWDAMTFTIDDIESDPLARFDLYFEDNSLKAIEANNGNITITGGTATGAYYGTSEGVFKSRLTGDNPESGPFTSATRRRNATRLASRYLTNPPILSPQPGASGEPAPPFFLYSGMGDSVWRVNDAGINNITNVGGDVANSGVFALDLPGIGGDPTIVDAVIEARGIGFPGTIFGELPFGWGTY